MHRILLRAFAVSLAFTTAIGVAQAQAPSARIRGTIEQVAPDSITILTADGQHRQLALTPDSRIGSDRMLTLADIKAGDFIGTAAMKQPDGHLRALEVTVFPEALRGAGEGQRPWDQGPDSSMTNATVSEIAVATSGRTLKLQYKGGTADVEVPPDVPIVTPVEGDRSLLIAGKAVVAYARQNPDGTWTAARLTVEKDGVKPP